jgi:hypothetical protein
MYFSNQALFRTLSIMLVLLSISSCAPDTMIKINSTSSLKLVANKEIRYKACGESSDSCQDIFKNINDKKSELAKIARARYIEYRDSKIQIARQEWQKAADQKVSENCSEYNTVEYRQAQKYNQGNIIARSEELCKSAARREVRSTYVAVDENSFNPTDEDHKKIIQEASNVSLNEYTFSKSDGSIVVICPTRYCAISSADGGWIGIGERGKPNELTSLISN